MKQLHHTPLFTISTPAGVSLPPKQPELSLFGHFLERHLTHRPDRANETIAALNPQHKQSSTVFPLDFTQAKQQSETLGGEFVREQLYLSGVYCRIHDVHPALECSLGKKTHVQNSPEGKE